MGRILLNRILEEPLKPVSESSMPFCAFLVNLFQDMSDELLRCIHDLEYQQQVVREDGLDIPEGNF